MHKTSFWIFGFSLLMGTSTVAAQPGDFVVGAGRFESVGAKVEISARSDADGANANGRFRLRQPGTADSVIGEVTCLAVNGSEGAAGGVIVKSNDPDILAGETFFQIVRDNGQGQDDNDESQTILDSEADPASCADFLGFDPDFIMDRGNYEVKDR